jgi:hypothetical protein
VESRINKLYYQGAQNYREVERMWSLRRFLCAIPVIYNISFSQSIIPPEVLNGEIQSSRYPLAHNINAFVANQTAGRTNFKPTGLSHSDYLPTIESLVRAMLKYRNNNGQIVDPVRKR